MEQCINVIFVHRDADIGIEYFSTNNLSTNSVFNMYHQINVQMNFIVSQTDFFILGKGTEENRSCRWLYSI